jgi:hypothetical protein
MIKEIEKELHNLNKIKDDLMLEIKSNPDFNIVIMKKENNPMFKNDIMIYDLSLSQFEKHCLNLTRRICIAEENGTSPLISDIKKINIMSSLHFKLFERDEIRERIKSLERVLELYRAK